jgi:hypothetical protein
MGRKKMIRNTVLALGMWLMSQSPALALSMIAIDEQGITESTQSIHNIQFWWGKEVVQANVQILFGGKPIVDGTFTFEAHAPRARYDRKGGASIYFDGNTAWVHPPDAEAPKGRFHVLTWPWLIMAPFKMQGDGINLSEASYRPLNGDRYKTVFQTFGKDMGDTTGQVSGIQYLAAADADFEVPQDASELKMPPQRIDYTDYARLLDSYVTNTGVRYEAWFENKDDLSALDDFLAGLAEVDLSRYSEAEQKAFYINLYNAAMLQAVFKAYPTKSVKSIGLIPFSIFKKNFIKQNGRKLSLDEVEKGILLKDFFDPRIHFAVNCASKSCPPLRDEPFIAAKLENQLEEQTKAFAISARAARVVLGKERVEYSELFKWYEDDFEVENPAEYLNRYRDMPLPLDLKVDWISYDWSLNTAE